MGRPKIGENEDESRNNYDYPSKVRGGGGGGYLQKKVFGFTLFCTCGIL